MSTTEALTEFLLARIAEREAVARDMEHHAAIGRPFFDVGRLAGGTGIRELIDPARVLAECEAKRRIVEWHSNTEDCCEERLGPVVAFDGDLSAGVDASGNLTVRQAFATQAYLGCVTLMMLALPYADHPDYREEWRP